MDNIDFLKNWSAPLGIEVKQVEGKTPPLYFVVNEKGHLSIEMSYIETLTFLNGMYTGKMLFSVDK